MGNAIIFFHALTPIHTGTGQAVDVIDLPVAREKVTGWPYIPGSSIKGVLRDAAEKGDKHKRAFGPETENAKESAGNLLFCDARLLCFPVRSFSGTFAWVTCPSAITRLSRDCAAAGLDGPPPFTLPENWEFASVITTPQTALRTQRQKNGNDVRIILEEYDLTPLEYDLTPLEENISKLADFIAGKVFSDSASREHFLKRFALVHDDMFSTLTETATEVVARIALDERKKVVKQGALWYEEAVPAEAIFVSPLINAERNPEDDLIADYLVKQRLSPVQIGGNASVGRGLVRIVLNGSELNGGQ
ncbi:MAG: type III-B CRISPR module RAMP protein Cmr4 [Armatimonadota bacterium]|nr:MAG: type III-B CRISPR module RAMP protein Cmr4 [Armatimonadota bacterium]